MMREMAPTRVGQVTGDGTWRLRGARRLTRSRATETRGPVQPACCALAEPGRIKAPSPPAPRTPEQTPTTFLITRLLGPAALRNSEGFD
jgi:hypothetical protein